MRKPILLKISDFTLHEIGADVFYPEKTSARVSFRLEKGAYATVALRELLKNE